MEITQGHLSYKLNNKKRSIIFGFDNISNNDVIIKLQNIKIKNTQKLIVTIKPLKEIIIEDLKLIAYHNFDKEDKLFLNGYQSWTESKEFNFNDKIEGFNNLLIPMIQALYKVKNFGDSNFFKYTNKKGNLHGFTYTYIKNVHNNLIFCGSLKEDSGYTIFHYITSKNMLLIKKDCKGLKIKNNFEAFNLMISNGNESEVFSEYFKNFGLNKLKTKPLAGWTSWYNYYTKINEDIILENLKAFSKKKIPINVFQIDDGYQKAVGDWLEIKNSFPHGMRYIASKIKEKRLKPGIWIAPFICQKNSDLFRMHNEWILKDEKGEPIILGYSKDYWEDHFYPLDFNNKAVKNYLKKVFHTIIKDWEFEFIKVDFLYAVSMISNDENTRAKIMFDAIKFLREIAGNTLLLGCGTPLAPAFNILDYCRIGSDVTLTWEQDLYKKLHFRERPSTLNSLTNTLYRRHLNGKFFWNDPDVFMLREENTSLTQNQKYTLLMLNLLFGGLIFTSDNINKYSGEIFDLYTSQFPIKEKKIESVQFSNNLYTIRFSIEDKTYLAFANFNDDYADIKLSEGYYFNSKDYSIIKSCELALDPFESICYLILSDAQFEIAGSNHIFPGSDVKYFKVEEDNIILQMDKKAIGKRKVYIKIPSNLSSYNVNEDYYYAEKYFGLRVMCANIQE